MTVQQFENALARVIALAEEGETEDAAQLLKAALGAVPSFRYQKVVSTDGVRKFRLAHDGTDQHGNACMGAVTVYQSAKGDLLAKVDTIDTNGGTLMAGRNLRLEGIKA